MTHGVDEMRLAETDSAIDEQRIVARARARRRRHRSRVGELIRWTDHERFESILRVQIGRGPRRLRRAWRRCRLEALCGSPVWFCQRFVDLPVDLDARNLGARAQ